MFKCTEGILSVLLLHQSNSSATQNVAGAHWHFPVNTHYAMKHLTKQLFVYFLIRVYTHTPLASVWSAGLTHVSLKGSVLASSWWHHHQHSPCRLLSQTPSCLFTTVEFFQSWGNGGDWWGAELRYYNWSSQVHTGQEQRSTIWWQSWLSLSDGATRTKIKQMVKHWNIGTSTAVVQSFFTLNNNK